MTTFIFYPNVFQEFLNSETGRNIRKVYFDGINLEFQKNSFNFDPNREKVDEKNYFRIYVQNEHIKKKIQESNTMAMDIISIESLIGRINQLEQSIKNGEHSGGLNGIVTILPDSDGKVGLYIPGLLQIDNQEQNDLRGTDGNLVLEHPHGRLLHRKQ